LGRVLVKQLQESDLAGLSQTLAFVVMRDHCHWLMVLKAKTVSAVVGQVKARSAKKVNELTRASGPLWQPGFHDHALRQEEDIPAIARYIVANPLRAGLVSRVGDYALWDAIWLTDSPS
jgi:putative transposase